MNNKNSQLHVHVSEQKIRRWWDSVRESRTEYHVDDRIGRPPGRPAEEILAYHVPSYGRHERTTIPATGGTRRPVRVHDRETVMTVCVCVTNELRVRTIFIKKSVASGSEPRPRSHGALIRRGTRSPDSVPHTVTHTPPNSSTVQHRQLPSPVTTGQRPRRRLDERDEEHAFTAAAIAATYPI
jgi:hypothetical protein